MDAQTVDVEPPVLDTYALVYGFGMALMVPALFLIERFEFVPYEPGFMALVLTPFVVGVVATFLTDSSDGPGVLGRRALVLTPLTFVGGITILFVAELAIILPVSVFLSPSNFDVLAPIFAASLALVASPLVLALVRRVRKPITAAAVFQMVALIATLAIVAWTLVMTFDDTHVLGTFLRHDLLDYFAGTQTWFLPSLGLAAGIWRRLGIV
jgi:hypothetical protein